MLLKTENIGKVEDKARKGIFFRGKCIREDTKGDTAIFKGGKVGNEARERERERPDMRAFPC